jgi:hypothetical protein
MFNKSALCSHSVFMGLLLFSKQTVVIILNSINQLIFEMMKRFVLLAAGTECLSII